MYVLQATEAAVRPALVIVLSGKRKCGKDFFADQLVARLGTDRVEIMRLSGPLKAQYAKVHPGFRL